MSPAFSTARANAAFSERNPYPRTYQKASLLIEATLLLTWVNHLRAMLDGNLDDLVASKVCANRRVLASLADDVGFVGLCKMRAVSIRRGEAMGSSRSHTLPVHTEAVLIATKSALVLAAQLHEPRLPEDCNGVQAKLVGLELGVSTS